MKFNKTARDENQIQAKVLTRSTYSAGTSHLCQECHSNFAPLLKLIMKKRSIFKIITIHRYEI